MNFPVCFALLVVPRTVVTKVELPNEAEAFLVRAEDLILKRIENSEYTRPTPPEDCPLKCPLIRGCVCVYLQYGILHVT